MAHNSDFEKPIIRSSKTNIDLDNPKQINAYSIAKLTTELKHRTYSQLNIIDLRVFNYLRTINIDKEGSIIGDIFNCLLNDKIFKTTKVDIKRDYINSQMFFEIVKCIIDTPRLNRGFDLYSKKHIGKLDIINLFSKNYGLLVEFVNSHEHSSITPTGMKPCYYSTNRDLALLGCNPRFSSLDLLKNYAENILSSQGFSD